MPESMISLARWGVVPTGTSTLLHGEEVRAVAKDVFFSRACERLWELRDVVMTRVARSLDECFGTWHPSGFMAYPLGEHPEIGSLRLHVWPEGLRRRVTKGRGPMGDIYDGDIHN